MKYATEWESTKVKTAYEDLSTLTDIEFKNPTELMNWLRENRDYLNYDEINSKTYIDTEAKKASIPTVYFNKE